MNQLTQVFWFSSQTSIPALGTCCRKTPAKQCLVSKSNTC